MLTEICQYLKNWFNRKPDGTEYPKYSGKVVISGGKLIFSDGFSLTDGQYFRVMGSLFNDGVHRLGSDALTDEIFDGAVWSMAVPPVVVSLAEDIAAWQTEYGTIGSTNMSPFQSESFGGYSYSKGVSGGNGEVSGNTWQGVFADRLSPWRKI